MLSSSRDRGAPEKQILSRPMFYLSAYLEAHRDEYVQALRGLGQRKHTWDNWVAFFLNALCEQARENSSCGDR
jgi:cell filamentation protein, protein adenylyltransferase